MAKSTEQERAITLEELLRDARRNPPESDWVSVRDHSRGVEAFGPIDYCMKSYDPGEKFVCLKQIARSWEDQGRVRIIQGGRAP